MSKRKFEIPYLPQKQLVEMLKKMMDNSNTFAKEFRKQMISVQTGMEDEYSSYMASFITAGEKDISDRRKKKIRKILKGLKLRPLRVFLNNYKKVVMVFTINSTFTLEWDTIMAINNRIGSISEFGYADEFIASGPAMIYISLHPKLLF